MRRLARRVLPLSGLLALIALPGCSHFRHFTRPDYVYVVSKGTYLRDRIAVIANHVETIHNGERLEVVEHNGRFYKLKTPDGKVGWLEEHSVITQADYDQFTAQAAAHAHDPVVATATLLNMSHLHLTPGRKAEYLYVLAANDRLQLLVRASVPKPLPPQAILTPKSLKPRVRPKRPVEWKPRQQSGSTVWAEAPPHPDRYTAPDLDPNQPWMTQPMEDWWLVRDQAGRVGWVLSRSFNVDIPDDVAQYSEGRRIVGAYLLNTVMDNGEPPPKSEKAQEAERKIAARTAARAARAKRRHQAAPVDEAAALTAPAPVPHPMGQWLTVTSEYKDGLPFDWDQVRVFIWNTRKHRYETAYRLRELQGYLPVTIGKEPVDKMGEEPTFTIRTSPDGVVTQDAEGLFHPQSVNTTQYRLEGGIVRRDTPLPLKPGEAASPARASATRPEARSRSRKGPRRPVRAHRREHRH